jgi:hypothetical protein
MKQIAWLVLGCLVQITTVLADEFNIEDDQLQPIPTEVASAIQADKSFQVYKDAGCSHLVGSSADLNESGRQSDWIATTARGCAWGAATGPIWVIHHSSTIYTVVLASGGHNLTIGKPIKNGLRQLAISAGTAGWYSESLLKFDGSKYVVVHTRNIDLSDPEDCRKNKDVCP